MTSEPLEGLAGKVREALGPHGPDHLLGSSTTSRFGAREVALEALAALLARAEELERERDEIRRAFNTEVRVCSARTKKLQAAEDALRVAREGLEALGENANCGSDARVARQLLAAMPQAEDGA